ncbi:MAG: ACP S-malonyltransferase [Spirochaetia bacterium]|nr:ACP S-malonyltransferase [Spirochaetia bacterium]
MGTPALLKTAQEGKAGFYIQFGGQGSPWYKELSKFFREPHMKKFFDTALAAVEEEMKLIGATVGLPNGLDARKWLNDETTIPSEDYLGCAAVSIPMIQITQLAHLENLSHHGYDRSAFVQAAHGASGHSQGLIPASLVALGLTGDAYYDALSKYVKYLLYLGVRAQEVYPHFAPSADELARSTKLGAGAPAPMVAVLGETHEYIEGLVNDLNSGLSPSDKIYVSLYNSPSNRILSAPRGSLVSFHEKNKAALDEKKVKFVYLRTTCPFHCGHMEKIGQLFEPDIKRIGFDFKGSDLKIPVWSFFDETNLQSNASLPVKMYKDMAVHALYWEKSMKPAADNAKVTHIVDFGPGKTSQRLSQDTLAGLKCEKPVLAAAFAKDLTALLAP